MRNFTNESAEYQGLDLSISLTSYIVNQAVSDLRHTIADWLSPLNFFQKQSDVLSRRHPGTGQWLLDSGESRDWISGAEQTLWCRGILMYQFSPKF
jgi:hypothetical protein